MIDHESHVERLIRESMERGEFDNLPGAGKPLALPRNDDPAWWIRRKMEEDDLDPAAALPATLRLRKEGAGFPASLAGIGKSAEVRAVLEDYNRRVLLDRLEPRDGPGAGLLAPTVDVEQMLEQWRPERAQPD